jgi:hypothetical protein
MPSASPPTKMPISRRAVEQRVVRALHHQELALRRSRSAMQPMYGAYYVPDIKRRSPNSQRLAKVRVWKAQRKSLGLGGALIRASGWSASVDAEHLDQRLDRCRVAAPAMPLPEHGDRRHFFGTQHKLDSLVSASRHAVAVSQHALARQGSFVFSRGHDGHCSALPVTPQSSWSPPRTTASPPRTTAPSDFSSRSCAGHSSAAEVWRQGKG